MNIKITVLKSIIHLNDEITLKENNFISKNRTIKSKDYFELFFPFGTNVEMSYTVTNSKVKKEKFNRE